MGESSDERQEHVGADESALSARVELADLDQQSSPDPTDRAIEGHSVASVEKGGISTAASWLTTVVIGAFALIGGHQLGRWLDERPGTASVAGPTEESSLVDSALEVDTLGAGIDRFATVGPESGDGTASEVGLRVALGELAPDFSLPSPDGEDLIALSDYRGSPVLVNFWATWCPPCRHEMPFLQSQYEARADIGLVVLAVDVGEEPNLVQEYLSGTDLTFPVVLDLFGDIADYYRIVTFPTTYLIDREGRIASVKRGPYASEADVARAVDALIAIPEG